MRRKINVVRNPDVDKLNTVFYKIDQEHKTLIDSMIDNCVDSTLIAAVTHNKFEFDTRRKEWFLKIRGSFCDDANLPSSSKPGLDLLSSKAPSECSRARVAKRRLASRMRLFGPLCAALCLHSCYGRAHNFSLHHANLFCAFVLFTPFPLFHSSIARIHSS